MTIVYLVKLQIYFSLSALDKNLRRGGSGKWKLIDLSSEVSLSPSESKSKVSECLACVEGRN
jgi:hypothetical protein